MAAPAGHAAFIQELVRGRNAVRAFRADPVPEPTLREVFDLAQWAPSNCNTQPWTVYLASGEKKKRLTAKLIERMDDAQPDIPYNAETYPPLFKARRADHLTHKQNALGIAHESKTRRHEILTANLTSFGAPHLALLYMPAWVANPGNRLTQTRAPTSAVVKTFE